jgi:hypothetical protein
MKHLLTGVAMAAALAIAAPVWAQNAPTPGGNNPTSGSAWPLAPKPAAPAPAAAPAKPMAAKMPMHHRHWRHHPMNAGDSMTEQLNQQELQRIMGGAPAPMPMTPGGNNPTSGTAGPFAPAGAAPPPPAQK